MSTPHIPPSPDTADRTSWELNDLIRRSGFSTPVHGCERLKGDASNRTYSRIQLGAGSVPATLILMELAEPEAFKRSEEAISASDFPVTELPFLNIQRYLRSRGLGVPRIYDYDVKSGRLVLEDLGDVTLWDAIAGAPTERIENLYRSALDELVKLQGDTTDTAPSQCLAFGRRFDRALLVWEFEHFLEYGVEARNEAAVSPEPRRKIRMAFDRIAEEIASAPSVLVHRDYHSRNLMVADGRIRLIDFQDALVGPLTYDLASLLRDSYVTLEEPLVDRLIAYYLSVAKGPLQDPTAFRRLFDLTSLQRNLKAAGRFVYIEKVKGRATHLPYVAPTLRSVRRNIEKYADLADLRNLLIPLVPELA
ncbi:MAG: phosphotransferase [Nitrospirae bacterium]|nr:phosphotransferase [Nitrospirota bacterium]